ncbi:MAG TPA: M15 family metallopeptidase [Fimbriimonadaceae bacterium]|nr:M15 family metallopeptidase [Fimbriimonadaceae bacterium]
MRGERKKLSIEEPVSHLRAVPILDNGEPLVDWLGHPRIFQDQPRFKYHRETIARASVVEFLWRAADSLPKGYKLAVVEGWRPPYIQRRMFAWSFQRFKERYPDWTDAKLKKLASQFTAPMDEHVPPPHTTGGAIDLMLANENHEVLDHLSPYAPRDHHAFPFTAPGLSDTARRHRDMLAEAFATGRMTNYPSEYWHWSYGDQGWAYRGRHLHALYAAITPAGWHPSPEDDTDEPLTWVM